MRLPAATRPLATMTLRLLALVGKELVEVVRRPGALASLIFGPFLIMAIFGLGYGGQRRPLDTIVVIPPSSGLADDVATYQDLAGGGLHIVGVRGDFQSVRSELENGSLDVAVIAPADAAAQFKAGEQSTIQVVVDTVDPIEANYAGFLAANLANAVNQTIIKRAVQESESYAIRSGQPDATAIPPDVVAAPTKADVINIAPSSPQVLAYFGPAVMALILQHLAVTLVALSLVRERTSGVIELFRVAPVNAWELIAGKVVAYLFIGALVGGATASLLIGVFGVPMLGTPASLALVIALLLLASLGVGLAIAVVSDSERQAVQLSLLVLLASVFFSGFVLSIQEFTVPVQAMAFLLPVTSGIQLTQDVMLRGTIVAPWQLAVLGAIALVTSTGAWIGLRRNTSRT